LIQVDPYPRSLLHLKEKIMKSAHTILRLTSAVALAGSAFAAHAANPYVFKFDELGLHDNPAYTAPALTRAQVQAELFEFRKGPNPWSTRYDHMRAMKASLSREQVRTEAMAAVNQGTAVMGEDGGTARGGANRSRSQFVLNQR
jgi:Domain of unknown function (DUF4148)